MNYNYEYNNIIKMYNKAIKSINRSAVLCDYGFYFGLNNTIIAIQQKLTSNAHNKFKE